MSMLVNSFWGTVAAGSPPRTPPLFSGLSITGVVDYPVGLWAGDIAFISSAIYDATTVNSINTPAGWTLVSQNDVAIVGYSHAVFWKRLSGSESGTVTLTTTNPFSDPVDTWVSAMGIWRGCVASGTPYEQLGSNTATNTSMAGTGVTTAGVNRTVLDFATCENDTLSAPAAGWTEQYDYTTTSGSPDGGLKLYSIERPAAGSYGAATHTLAASQRWQVTSLALIPA